MRKRFWLITLFVLLITSCVSATGPVTATPTTSTGQGENAVAIQLTSSAFENGKPIPSKYTCDGQNTSVPLQWTDPPANTASLALIVDDPDAPSGTFVHWVIYNLPAKARSLAEGISADATLPDGSRNGVNSSRHSGYMGPCPPSGTHRYFFKLYALDTALSLKPGATKDQLLAAMKDHIVAQAELMGTYKK